MRLRKHPLLIWLLFSRECSLERHLQSKQLYTVNVAGDGNCFFRAISVALYDRQKEHSAFRTSVSERVFSKATTDVQKQFAMNILKDGTWVCGNRISTTASYLQRQMQVYFASDVSSPLVYKSSFSRNLPKLVPVHMAFYEPGHYRCVLHRSESSSSISQGVARNAPGNVNTHAKQVAIQRP